MARTGLRVGLCAVSLVAAAALLLLPPCGQPAARGGDDEDRLDRQIQVQAALRKGVAHLQAQEFAAAVAALEKQIPYIDGNGKYLAALRDAYRGHVQALARAGRTREAALYRSRLAILEPARQVSEVATTSPPLKQHELPARPAPTGGPTDGATATPPRLVAGGSSAEKKSELVGRGTSAVEDRSDPFAEGNSATAAGQQWLDRAEKEFADRHYDRACRFYDQADQVNPALMTGCQERWAYCKLYVIAQAVNSGSADPALEAQVRRAVRMSPRLDAFAQGLLKKLREGDESAVAVKHGRHGAWKVADTTNFRILHTGTLEEAEKIARVAEATRARMSRQWFGDTNPAAWSPRCDLYIHATVEAYAKATGAPTDSPGHSTLSLEGARVVARRVDLAGDNPHLLTGYLPHETTHVVLAGRFGKHHVPRWADEGMAVLSEPRERVELHTKNLAAHRRERLLFRVADLIRQENYPPARRVAAFYAQSVSLVEFLVKKKDAVTFTRFLQAGLSGEYESALERYFGYRNFAELERDWLAATFGGEETASAEKR